MPSPALLVISLVMVLSFVQLRPATGEASPSNTEVTSRLEDDIISSDPQLASVRRSADRQTAGEEKPRGQKFTRSVVGDATGQNRVVYSSRQLLNNSCSHKFVRIRLTDRLHADAKGNSSQEFSSLLDFVRDENSTVRILRPQEHGAQRHKTAFALCFSTIGNGQLVVKMANSNRNNPICKFREVMDEDGKYKIMSEFNPDWYVGFNRKGEPFKGDMYMWRPEIMSCYEFIKTTSTDFGIHAP